MNTIEQLVEALKLIVETPPAQQDGGGFIVEHFDGDGNYAGSQNIDPMWVIQEMQAIACAAIAAGEAELKREPVAIYNGTMDCGETGAFDLTLLKMIPRGAKLYTRSDQ